MIKERRQTRICTPRAGTFPGLMELYERNYMLLRRLVPDFDTVASGAVSVVTGALDLHLELLERCRYTTTLRLTYYFEDEQGRFPAPEIVVRVYHDAQLAEVLSCGRRRGVRHADYDRFRGDQPMDRKWQFNRFLQKWLAYSLRQGHAFLPPLPGEIWDSVSAGSRPVR